MEILQQTFDYHLSSAKQLLQKANSEENPAKWLYQNNFRTTLFMLEALARTYKAFSDKELFTKLIRHFKISEDLIGKIDYFHYYAQEVDNEQAEIALLQKAEEKEMEYNELLIDKNWLNGKRIKKIEKRLKELAPLSIKEETEGIRNFYKEQIDKIVEFSRSPDFKFRDIEDDVHEIRRKLRWLSIYPQAFLGLFRYAHPQTTVPPHIQKYLTDKILNSPYNVFPDRLHLKDHVLINKNYFLTLSWIIDSIGDLKDEGLEIEALNRINLNTKSQTENNEEIHALLKNAKNILVPFFEEKNLEHLLH